MKKDQKIFCISFQRTGTTSTGDFLRKNGFRICDNGGVKHGERQWVDDCFNGNYEKIFQSEEFNNSQVFKDAPWFFGDFYKVLYHRFPNSKFILITRDSDEWFDSLKSLFNDVENVNVIYVHFKIYGLEDVYHDILKSNDSPELPRLIVKECLRERYKSAYDLRNNEVLDFFNQHDNSRLIHLQREDPLKWKTLGDFFDIKNIKGLDTHTKNSFCWSLQGKT